MQFIPFKKLISEWRGLPFGSPLSTANGAQIHQSSSCWTAITCAQDTQTFLCEVELYLNPQEALHLFFSFK